MFDDLTAARFWSKVRIAGADACWEWQGGHTSDGYGSTRIEGKSYRAHRIALGFASEDMPVGMHALHSCDNPPCCNPHHLRWGKDMDNVADRSARGRDGGFARVNRNKTHCVKGHELSEENVKLRRGRQRNCLICVHASQRKWVESVAAKRATLIEGRSA